jgi:HK97 family phage prohead protease
VINLQKTLSLNDVELKFAKNGKTFEGYASTFNNVDSYGDTILPGAYKNVLNSGIAPKMFFNHKSWELPIGKYDMTQMTEDSKGLIVVGELTPGLRTADDVAAAMAHKTIDGLSIGYGLQKTDFYLENDVRYIKNISRLVEISPVIFPADDHARIDLDSVKGDLEGIETLRDLENFLRDAGQFSRGVVKSLIKRMEVVIKQEAGDDTIVVQEVKGEIGLLVANFKLPDINLGVQK